MTVKRALYVGCLLLIGCAAPRQLPSVNPDPVRALTKPIKIFGIGYWGTKYMVLTLVDAQTHYLVIKVPRNDSLKTGQVYQP